MDYFGDGGFVTHFVQYMPTSQGEELYKYFMGGGTFSLAGINSGGWPLFRSVSTDNSYLTISPKKSVRFKVDTVYSTGPTGSSPDLSDFINVGVILTYEVQEPTGYVQAALVGWKTVNGGVISTNNLFGDLAGSVSIPINEGRPF